MSGTPAGDQASVTVTIGVDPADAFEIFTRDIDIWWRRGPRFRNAPGDRGFVRIEPGVGGRVYESFDAGRGERVVEIGRTKVWDPPHRLLFEWRNSNFSPAEKTEVEVRFQPSASGTRVTVVHRGWSALRGDHPARHGLAGAEFSRMIGLWWGDQATSLRLHAQEKR
ncbi:MAG TPA: SRPBCC domain-containing protein [Usitatibacter sp.]